MEIKVYSGNEFCSKFKFYFGTKSYFNLGGKSGLILNRINFNPEQNQGLIWNRIRFHFTTVYKLILDQDHTFSQNKIRIYLETKFCFETETGFKTEKKKIIF